MEELTKAQRRGIPIRGLGARRASRVAHSSDAESDADGFAATASNDGAISREHAAASIDIDVDFEEDGLPIRTRPKGLRAMLADCRYRSRSVWLYFPHIELLFLLFAFEGAIASQLATMRGGGCPWVFYLACTSLVRHTTLFQKKTTVLSGDSTVTTGNGELFVLASGALKARWSQCVGMLRKNASKIATWDAELLARNVLLAGLKK